MNASEQWKPAGWRSAACLAPLGLVLAAGLCVFGVTGYFRLSSDTATLRRSAMGSMGGAWDTRIAVHIGAMTMALVRTGSRVFPLEAEPRAALETLRGAEVGIYKLASGSICANRKSLLAAVDKGMAGRGWQRVAGVCVEQEVVGVYVPGKRIGLHRMKVCVMVLHDRDLVVASVRGNLEPLMALAAERLDLSAVAASGPPATAGGPGPRRWLRRTIRAPGLPARSNDARP